MFLAVNALLLRTSWALSRRLFPTDRWFQNAGSSLIISWATIVLIGTGIGAVGLLIPWLYVLLVGLAAAGAGVYLGRTDGGPADGPVGARPPARRGNWSEVLFTGIWGCVISFWVVHNVLYGVCRIPGEWDTLMYHLPFVDHWLQRGSLYAPECHMWSNPGNNELMTLWVVGPFTGDFFYNLANLPGVLLMAAGAFEVARHLGLSFYFRQLAGLVVVTHQLIQAQLQDAGNDVAVAGFFLSCLAYVLRYVARGRQPDLVLGVVALGLLAGTKYYALGYALIAVLIAVALIALKFGWRGAVRAVPFGAVGMGLFGGYWYLRNLFVTGTPLYPFGARSPGNDLSDVYPAVWESTFVGNESPELFELAMAAIWDVTGPCHWAAVLLLPLTVTWAALSKASWRGPVARGRTRAALAVGALAAVGIWLITPFAVESYPGTLNQMHYKYCPIRYGLCPLSLCVLMLCVAASDLARGTGRLAHRALGCVLTARWSRRLARLAAGCVTLACGVVFLYQCDNQQIYNSTSIFGMSLNGLWDTMIVGAALFINGAAATLVVCEFAILRRLARPLLAVTFIAALGGSAVGAGNVSERWHREYTAYYDSILGGDVFRKLTDATSPGDTICVMDERYYPFFGSARQFRIVQPPSTQSSAWWADSPERYRCKFIVIRPEVKFKWTQMMELVPAQTDVFIGAGFSPPNHAVYAIRSP